jgi:hypothetical protein
LRRGLKDLTAALLYGRTKRGLAAGPASTLSRGNPLQGAPASARPSKIRKREPDAWAAETDGTRECQEGGRYGRPLFFLQALRLAIARAMRRPIVISEATDWTPIVSFARLLSGIVSVGL